MSRARMRVIVAIAAAGIAAASIRGQRELVFGVWRAASDPPLLTTGQEAVVFLDRDPTSQRIYPAGGFTFEFLLDGRRVVNREVPALARGLDRDSLLARLRGPGGRDVY